MKRHFALRFTTLEMTFLLAAVVVLAAGSLLSYTQRAADWMPGVGALIIVLGVAFALWDLPNLLAMQADQWAKVRKEFAVRSKIDEIEEDKHTVLSEDERRRIRAEVEKQADKLLPSHAQNIRKRFHFVEAFIVCLGTLVNGFGQMAIEWLLA